MQRDYSTRLTQVQKNRNFAEGLFVVKAKQKDDKTSEVEGSSYEAGAF